MKKNPSAGLIVLGVLVFATLIIGTAVLDVSETKNLAVQNAMEERDNLMAKELGVPPVENSTETTTTTTLGETAVAADQSATSATENTGASVTVGDSPTSVVEQPAENTTPLKGS